jgi:hypothetical protein
LLRHVLLLAEHTWGTDTKTWLDFENYLPADLEKMLDTKNYRVVEFSWIEKRQDLRDGVATLPETLREEALMAIDGLTPAWPVFSPSMSMAAGGRLIQTERFLLRIDGRTGAITQLEDKATGREWASEKNPIALFTYQTLSQEDYQRFLASYLTTKADWAQKDFGKPNIERFGAKSEEWQGSTEISSVEEREDEHRVAIHLGLGDDAAFAEGRAASPRHVFLELVLPKGAAEIHLKLTWFGKPATRMPEAMWLTFNPVAEDTNGWMFEKSGEWISPFDVVASGNRHMHCLEQGFRYQHGADRFAVDTIDAPVVALGERSPLAFSNDQPDLTKGIHSCLFNNAWGTNYIQWYGEAGMARYVIRLG